MRLRAVIRHRILIVLTIGFQFVVWCLASNLGAAGTPSRKGTDPGTDSVRELYTWSGDADVPEWYAFNVVEGTSNPEVWVNNWGKRYDRYPGDPAPESMPTPGGTDTATIGVGGTELRNNAAVASLEIGIGGSIGIYGRLQCLTLDTAGLVELGHDALIYECALQADAGYGIVRTVEAHNSTLTDPLLENLIVSSPVEVPAGMCLGLSGEIHLNNIIEILAAGGNLARLVIDHDVTLSGNGWVETTDDPNNEISAHFGAGQRLTNRSTIHAAGRLCGTTIALTNEGLVIADRTATLTIDPVDSPNDGLTSVINTGTLRAADGGTLRLKGGVIDNTGGIIEALDSSAVELARDAVVTGGTLQTSGSGEIRSAHEYNNTTVNPKVRDLTVTGKLVIPDWRRLEVAGTVVIDGELDIESTGNGSRLNIDTNTTLTGSGSILTSDDYGNEICGFSSSGQRLTNQIEIHAAGRIGWTTIALTNQGEIVADRSTMLSIDPVDTPNDGLAAVINTGVLAAASGGTLELRGGNFDNFGGTIEARDGGVVALGVDLHLTGGDLNTAGGGVIQSNSSWHPPILTDVTLNGRTEVPSNTVVVFDGNLVDNGIIEVSGRIQPSGDVVLGGGGELRFENFGEITPDGTSFSNAAGHTMVVSAGAQTLVHQQMINAGTLIVEGSGFLQFNQSYEAEVGALTEVDGTLRPQGGTMPVGGILSGGGVIDGPVEITSTGVLSPGPGSGDQTRGVLTTGDLTVRDGAAYRWQTSALDADLVDVAGNLDIGAATLTVEIRVSGGDVPERVELFSYDSLASIPDVSQFLLTGGFSFTGVDAGGGILALTGVAAQDLVFVDDFETGETSSWTRVEGETEKSLRFEREVDWLRVDLSLPGSVVDQPRAVTVLEALAADGVTVFGLQTRQGMLRAGILTAEGRRWSPWRESRGLEVEVQWRPGRVWVYDSGGLLAEAGSDSGFMGVLGLRRDSAVRVRVKPAAIADR